MRGTVAWVGLAALAVIITAGWAGVYLRNQTVRTGSSPTVATPQPTFTPTAVAEFAADSARAADETPDLEFVQVVAEDAVVFNPVLTSTDTGAAVLGLIYPRLIGRDAQTGVITATELATGWELSPDGRTYTFTLRSGVQWSDGQPVTSADFRYTYEALDRSPVQSPVQDRLDAIAQIETPDPQTVVLRLDEPDCAVLNSLRLPLLPSHRYAPDYADLDSNPLNTRPDVSAGPFRFVEWAPGERIVLEGNPGYWKGTPVIEQWVMHVERDPQARLQMMANGEADLLWLSAQDVAQAQAELPVQVELSTYPAPAVQFLALNLADPQNPQAGRDEAGNLVAQSPHPVLGDIAVRRAIAASIDYVTLTRDAFGGQGNTPASAVLPTVPWAHSADLNPTSYRPEEAAAALENAGWVDTDGDGVRERAGNSLSLNLLTNEENPARVRAADLIASQLGEAGFQVVRVNEPFDATAAAVLGQRYDMALMGWDNLSPDPGVMPLWRSEDDVPGSGVNFTSFQDPQVDEWLSAAQTVPGCGLQERGELYRQVQRRVAEALPYVFVHGDVEGWAVGAQWVGGEPGPWGYSDNMHEWRAGQ